jgi:coenzyme Q-binding protein COQ10
MSAEHVERMRLRHRPDELFELVSDVKRYPEFIKLITAMRIKSHTGHERFSELVAEARVRFRFVREQFTTHVTLDREKRVIDVSYLSGPFDDLANRWTFHPLEDGSTLVDFWIRYQFGNPVLQMLLDANRARAVRYLINAFREEAERRYDTVGEPHLDISHELRRLGARPA